jgi:1-aminocyclopropane-1-carboxylate deaminase/D-cysteine desulfhydrase-like pyridoxal-dependent ACC family enzyme
MTTIVTPLQQVGDFLLKRDDLFEVAGVRGGKARSCWAIAQGATGLVTASQRTSPQGKIVAHIARALGVGCRVYAPDAVKLGSELEAAKAAGADIRQYPAGRQRYLDKLAREDANTSGWRLIKLGMESEQAVQGMAAQALATVAQMNNQRITARRVVVTVGSGVSLAGILQGFAQADFTAPVIGVMVRSGRDKRPGKRLQKRLDKGAPPDLRGRCELVSSELKKRLDKWAPPDWRGRCELVPSELESDESATQLGNVQLHPIFEAKCIPFLKPGDLLWVIGSR